MNFTNWIASSKFDIPADVQKSVWQKQNIISNCFALPIVFLVGRLSDRMSPKLLVPGVLIFQIILMGGYMLCGDPTGWYAYVLSAFQGGSGYAVIVAMQGYAVKRVPKMIRGIVMALIISLSSLGGVIYLQVSKPFFETAPNMVFGFIGIFDIIVLVFILICIALGKYGDIAPQEDTFGEGNSQKHEKGTADVVKNDDRGFDDDIPEVPYFKDIYDEHIPEMSSEREASSFHTKKFLHKSGRSSRHVYDDCLSDGDEQNDIIIGSIRQTQNRNSYKGTVDSMAYNDQMRATA